MLFPIKTAHSTQPERFVPPKPAVILYRGVPLTQDQIAIKMAVEASFASVPLMTPIAGCESSYRQYGANGKPLISGTDDVGVMQVNIPTWSKKGKELGLDFVHSSEDNIKMAKYILDTQGISAWSCSRSAIVKEGIN